jgi:hypothetical protein
VSACRIREGDARAKSVAAPPQDAGLDIAWHGICFEDHELQLRIMEQLSPEFARYWLAGQSEAATKHPAPRASEDAPSAAQREAFEALAERVVAARTIL